MDIKEIKENTFYLHRKNYPVKVLDKNFQVNMKGSAKILIEIQESDFSIKKGSEYAFNLLCEINRTSWEEKLREKEQ